MLSCRNWFLVERDWYPCAASTHCFIPSELHHRIKVMAVDECGRWADSWMCLPAGSDVVVLGTDVHLPIGPIAQLHCYTIT